MNDAVTERALRAGLGALAGLGVWATIKVWGEDMSLAGLFLTLLALVFCAALLLLFRLGQLRFSAFSAAAIAVPVAGMMSWASLRYSETFGVIEAISPLLAAFFLTALPIPFLIAAGRADGDWRHYPTLFTVSWALALKSLAALLFVGIVWAVMMLSAELLKLVGLDFLEDLLRQDIVIWLLNGTAFGLGLAVLGELADIVVPRLVLQLLRLFLPVMVAVEVLFLLGLPFRGLSELFGGRSTAGVLMAIAIGAIGLISVATAEEDAEAVQGRLMRLSARILALLLPLIAALAAWAIWLRVRDYGWTPDRIAAALGAAIVAGYALCYALAALRGSGWMARLRRANVGMALALIALGVLWLSPVFDTGAISVQSQIARYQAGEATLEELPIWEIMNEWGKTGPIALERLAKDVPDPDAARLAKAISTASEDRFRLDRALEQDAVRAQIAELEAKAIIRPQGARLPDWISVDQSQWKVRAWLAACDREPRPGLPGCAFVIADFLPKLPGDEVMVLVNIATEENPQLAPQYTLEGWDPTRGGFRVTGDRQFDGPDLSSEQVFSSIESGNFSIGPVNVNALFIGNEEYMPFP
jgi:hypothetical protein